MELFDLLLQKYSQPFIPYVLEGGCWGSIVLRGRTYDRCEIVVFKSRIWQRLRIILFAWVYWHCIPVSQGEWVAPLVHSLLKLDSMVGGGAKDQRITITNHGFFFIKKTETYPNGNWIGLRRCGKFPQIHNWIHGNANNKPIAIFNWKSKI